MLKDKEVTNIYTLL